MSEQYVVHGIFDGARVQGHVDGLNSWVDLRRELWLDATGRRPEIPVGMVGSKGYRHMPGCVRIRMSDPHAMVSVPIRTLLGDSPIIRNTDLTDILTITEIYQQLDFDRRHVSWWQYCYKCDTKYGYITITEPIDAAVESFGAEALEWMFDDAKDGKVLLVCRRQVWTELQDERDFDEIARRGYDYWPSTDPNWVPFRLSRNLDSVRKLVDELCHAVSSDDRMICTRWIS